MASLALMRTTPKIGSHTDTDLDHSISGRPFASHFSTVGVLEDERTNLSASPSPRKEHLMSRFLLSIAAGVLTLALASPAHAHGHTGAARPTFGSQYRSVFNSPNTHSFVQTYGRRIGHGYAFSAGNFYWNRRSWSSRYGRYCYWCPYVNGWYYWNAAQASYYPLSYLSGVPPTPAVPPLGLAGPAAPGGVMPPTGPAVP